MKCSAIARKKTFTKRSHIFFNKLQTSCLKENLLYCVRDPNIIKMRKSYHLLQFLNLFHETREYAEYHMIMVYYTNFKILIINIQDNEKCKLSISQKKSDIFITIHRFIKYLQLCFQSIINFDLQKINLLFSYLYI